MRLIILSIALAVCSAQSEENAPSKQKSDPGATKSTKQDTGTEKAPFVIRIQPTEEDKKEAQGREQERQNKEKSDADLVKWTKVLAILAGLQFLALLLQSGIFAYQSRKLKETVDAANKQSTDMKSSIAEAARSATAMERVAESIASSARSASESVATSREIAARQKMLGALQLRAYVAAQNPYHQRRPHLSGGFRYYFQLQWLNSGSTSTRNMRTFVRFELRDSLLPADYAFAVPPSEVDKSFIAPRSHILTPLIPPNGVRPEDLRDVHSGIKFAYLWGWTTYRDVFPDSEEHITRFCLRIVVNGDPVNPGPEGHGVDFMYVFHNRHNCYDEECAEDA